MEKTSFTETLAKALPTVIVYHYKPVFEEILEATTDYQPKANENNKSLQNDETYLTDDSYLDAFSDLIYSNLDESITADDLAIKLESIQAGNEMLVGCLKKVEEFADKTGEFATQQKIARRLLQNVMSFILLLLSQVAKFGSELENILLEKSESALLPYGFDL